MKRAAMPRIIAAFTSSLLVLAATPAAAQYGGSPDQQVDLPSNYAGPDFGKAEVQADDRGSDSYDKDQQDDQAGPPPEAYDREDGGSCRRSDGTTGAIVGGGAGALIGRGIDRHGERGTGTIIGAVLGALIGHAVEQGSACR
jgi:hypothetical protein